LGYEFNSTFIIDTEEEKIEAYGEKMTTTDFPFKALLRVMEE
jgi:hypothetical protein